MKIIVTVVLVVMVSAILLSANQFLPFISIELHENLFINRLLKYQMAALILATLLMIITLRLNPESKSLLRLGDLDLLALKEKWLGIDGLTSWRKNAWQLAFFISLATGSFMLLAIKYSPNHYSFHGYHILIIILISLTNSFSEEMIYRFVIHGNLMSIMAKTKVLVLSSILFGLPHFLGFPNGIMGVIMAGVLGYILSKATYETHGLGIAWGIHFLQDVIIFSALFVMNFKQ